MEMGLQNEPVYSKQVIDFLTVANDFCIFIEKASDYDKTTILDYLNKVMPLLYLKGALLPITEISDSHADERFVTEEVWENIFSVIKLKLGKDDICYINENSKDENSQLIKISISELIADIYQDMKDFILLYQKNTKAAKENAVNSIRNYYLDHWGQRAIFVIKCAFDRLYPQKFDLFANE